MTERWYSLSPEQLETRLATDCSAGLSRRQAAARIKYEGKNRIHTTPKPSALELAKKLLRDPCAYMLLAAAILAWIFNEAVGAPLIIAITLFNAVVVLGAYIKAHSVIAAAYDRVIPNARVIREGKHYMVRQDMLCKGDLILLTKGDVVPADARVISANGLCCLETALTGEKEQKKKSPKPIYGNNIAPVELGNMVFASTIVAQGYGTAIICETAKDCLACNLQKDREQELKEPKVFSVLKKHCTLWSYIMLALVFLLTLTDFVIGFESRSIFNIFITGLSLATAGMCYYYLAFGYIIAGSGLYGMLGKGARSRGSGAVVKRISDLDELSGITTLILPKSGAFTAGNTALKKLYCNSELIPKDEIKDVSSYSSFISCAFDSTSYPQNDYEKTYNGFKARSASEEEKQIFSLARAKGVFNGPEYMGRHICLAPVFADNINGNLISESGRDKLVLRGRAEALLPLCTSYRYNGMLKDFKNEKKRINSLLKNLAEQGNYAIAIAAKYTSDINDRNDMVFEGLLTFNEPMLSGAMENVQQLKENGIRVIMTSEDSSALTRSYAKELGIIDSEEEILTSDKMKLMTDSLFRTNLPIYQLYEGLDIPQKRLLIARLQESGESVGYFGSELEDVILLRESDIGYAAALDLPDTTDGREAEATAGRGEAKSPCGCEALKQVCDVVTVPCDGAKGGFNAVAESVLTARRVVSSLYSAMQYLITAQCARLFIFIYSSLIPNTRLPFCGEEIFTPVQLLTLGLILDLAVVLSLAFRGRGGTKLPRIKGQSYGYIPVSMLFGVLWGVSALAFPVILRLMGIEVTNAQMSSAVFFGFMLTQLVCAAELTCSCSVAKSGAVFFKKFIPALLVVLAFILTCVYTPLGSHFGVCPLTPLQWLSVALQPIFIFAIYELHRIFENREKDSYDDDTQT